MQKLDSAKPESGVTTFGLLYEAIKNLIDTLRSLFSGNALFSAPVTGQLCLVETENQNGILYNYDSTWQDIAEKSTNFREKGVSNIIATAGTIDLDGDNKSFLNLNAATTVDNIINGNDGEEIFLRDNSIGAKTITNNAGGSGEIILSGAGNYTMTDGDVVGLILHSGVWYETGRIEWA